MKRRSLVKTLGVLGLLTPLFFVQSALAHDDDRINPRDFGEVVEKLLEKKSRKKFGFGKSLAASADDSTIIPREPGQSVDDRQFLAKGLEAEFVARNVGFRADMISFWPDDLNYSHLMVCIEGGREPDGAGNATGLNPSVQRVNVQTGAVETILFGMSRCDGLRTTQWGTVLATEETSDGGAYEIIDPLSTTGHWVADRGAPGVAADIRTAVNGADVSAKVVKRTALVTQAWEGLEVLDNGVVIGGDELRSGEDNDGGAIFRFVPSTFYDCENAPIRPGQLCSNTIDDLNDSPLAAGQNYALFTVCSGDDDYGQGCEYGRGGRWVKVNASTARADANTKGATGYCRPEDLHVDRSYGEFNGDEGIRWGWTNTCGGRGEVLFIHEDATALDAQDEVILDIGGSVGSIEFLANGGELTTGIVTRFVEGDEEMRNHDNLDIQPITSNVYVIEDIQYGDIWACLPDGADRDEATDGCLRMLSVRDPDAEPTGFIFDGTGTVAFYNIQHGQQHDGLLDPVSNPTPGEEGFTDDLIKISGFKIKHKFDNHRHFKTFKKRRRYRY